MSVAWFSELHALNEAGRFDEVVDRAAKYVRARPKDYALRLQVGKALLSLGRLKEARAQLDAAVKHSKGLAAWPWFYVAAVHARTGETEPMFTALEHAQAIDKKLGAAAYESPWFAAFWKAKRFQALFPRVAVAVKTARRGSTRPKGRAAPSRPSKPKRRAPAARGRTRGGASARRRGGA